MEYGVTLTCSPSTHMIAPRNEEAWRTKFIGPPKVKSGVRVTEDTALRYPPLWRAINLISGEVAVMPVDIFKKMPDGSGKEIDQRHRARRLIRRKSSNLVRATTFRKTLTAHALNYGNGYAWIERRGNTPIAMHIMDPSQTIVVLDDDDLWYGTWSNGERAWYPSANVFHIKGLGHSGFVGYPVTKLLADALGVGMAAQEYGGRFFGNGATMSGLLMIPGHMKEEKVRNLIKDFDAMQSGLNNAFKVGLIQDGAKYQKLSVDPEAGQFLETRQYEIRATVANITGCPPHMLGDDTRTSYNSLEQEKQSFLDHCLNQWLVEWEQEYMDKLLRDDQRETHEVEFKRQSILRMTKTDRTTSAHTEFQFGGLTVNEWLKMENRPTIGPDGDKRFRPANLVPLDQDETQEVPMETDDSQEEEDDRNGRLLRSMVTSSVTKSLKVERDRVLAAASRGTAFLDTCADFYSQWVTNSTLPDFEVAPFVRHAATSQRQLVDVASTSTDTQLAERVRELTATWVDGRSGQLVSELLGGE